MAVDKTPTKPAKKSRLLAALDGPAPMAGPSTIPAVMQTPINARGKKRTLGLTPDARSVLGERTPPAVLAGELQNRAALDLLRPGRGSAGSFNVNYDDQTPVTDLDVGGADQAERMAEFVTKSMENLSHNLTVVAAREKLGLTETDDLLPGLEVKLMPHQNIGVAWMVEQEKAPRHKGGILADDMGLGKTVQMIATMVINQPAMENPCHTTLIVVPAALLSQWKEEIETKTNNLFTVHVHHGKDKLKTIDAIQGFDCIITTYQTLVMEFNCPKDLEEVDHEDWLSENGGALARMKWYRVIIDEAQFIRNRATAASKSVAKLRSTYRWMLTGTPVTNSLADIFGLLRFGRFRPWNDWNDFNEHVAKVQKDDPPLAGTRAQAILNPLLLRRTKDSQLEGKPILELPAKTVEITILEFTEDERAIYDMFERQTQVTINKFIRQGTLLKNHAFVLVLILRLRQVCAHPNLVLEGTDGFDDPMLAVGTADQKERGRAQKSMGRPWVEMLKARFMTRARNEEMAADDDEADADPDTSCPVCQELYLSDSGRVIACGHEICFDCMLELSGAPIVHNGIFGQGNEKENAAAEKAYEMAVAKGHRPCPKCKQMQDLSPDKVFKSAAFHPTDEEMEEACRPKFLKSATPSSSKPKTKAILGTPVKVKFEDAMLSDSDDDLLDIGALVGPVKKEVQEEEVKVEVKAKKRSFFSDSDDDDVKSDIKPDIKPDIRPRISKHKRSRIESDDEDAIDLTLTSEDEKPKLKPKSVKINKVKGLHKSPCSPAPSQSKAKGKAKAIEGGAMDMVLATWRKGSGDVEASTKMSKMIELLQEWDYTGDKCIVFSQWTSMLDLVDTILGRHGIRSLKYDGRMDRGSREETLAAFKKVGGAKVMLISTRCGGVGLNLVSANRIINLDTSWNYASESQAYDRCHRMGQTKNVVVKRLIVKDTIEERMLKLQDVKVGLAEAALGEGSGTRLNKLSIRDIQHLFGMNKQPEKDPCQRQLRGHDSEDD